MRSTTSTLAALAALLVPAVAHADPPRDPAAAVTELAAQSDAKLARDPIDKAKKALERARGARGAGDDAHAHMLDDVARLWIRVGEQVLRAIRLEGEVQKVALEAKDIEAQVERARALLTETQSRHGQAAAELDRLEGKAKTVGGGALATPSPAAPPPPPKKPAAAPAVPAPSNPPSNPPPAGGGGKP